MPTESGDNKLLGNFRKLIDEVSADPNYNPGNSKLKKTALETQYTAGEAAASAVSDARGSHKLAITDRETGFKGLRPLAVRSRNYLKASGAPKPVTADAEEFIRKLSGAANQPKPRLTPTPIRLVRLVRHQPAVRRRRWAMTIRLATSRATSMW